MVCCGWRWCLGEVSNYLGCDDPNSRGRVSSATRKSSAGPGVDLPSKGAYSRGQLPPSPRLELPREVPSKQNPPIRHHNRTMAFRVGRWSRLLSISQQLIRQEQPSIEAQQSITNKAGWKSLYHGKAAGIFVKERPSQQQGSKHGATRTTVPAGLLEMFESLPPFNKAREWCHRKFVPLSIKETLGTPRPQ